MRKIRLYPTYYPISQTHQGKLKEMGEKAVKPVVGGLIVIQEDTAAQGKDQQDGFYPILYRQHHNSDEDEHHGPKTPQKGPTELKDVASGQKGDHSNKKEDDSCKQIPAFHDCLALGRIKISPRTIRAMGHIICQLNSGTKRCSNPSAPNPMNVKPITMLPLFFFGAWDVSETKV